MSVGVAQTTEGHTYRRVQIYMLPHYVVGAQKKKDSSPILNTSVFTQSCRCFFLFSFKLLLHSPMFLQKVVSTSEEQSAIA